MSPPAVVMRLEAASTVVFDRASAAGDQRFRFSTERGLSVLTLQVRYQLAEGHVEERRFAELPTRSSGADMITLTVNGTAHQIDAPADMPLLWALRDLLGLTGVKFGCGVASCGACVVHVDGAAVPACAMPIGSLEGAAVTTIEGLSGPEADALRAAWAALDVAQCGYCQSGQIMSAAEFLSRVPDPTDAQIEDALERNLCRCATYGRIRDAVRTAAATLRA